MSSMQNETKEDRDFLIATLRSYRDTGFDLNVRIQIRNRVREEWEAYLIRHDSSGVYFSALGPTRRIAVENLALALAMKRLS